MPIMREDQSPLAQKTPAKKPAVLGPPARPKAPIAPVSVHPDRIFDRDHPRIPDPTAGSKLFGPEGIAAWGEKEAEQNRVLPAGTDRYGEPRVRLAAADHRAVDKMERARTEGLGSEKSREEKIGSLGPAPTPPAQIMGELLEHGGGEKHPMMPGESFPEHFGKDLESYAVATSKVVNDLNHNIGDARRDLVNDPHTTADDRPTVYEVPSTGEKFKNTDKVIVYKFKDGTIMSEPDYKAMVAASQVTAWRLPNGKEYSLEAINDSQGDDWELITDKNDPRIVNKQASQAKDGKWYYCNSFILPGGEKISRTDMDKAAAVALVDPRSGRTVPYADNIPDYKDKKAWEEAVHGYQTPKGTTIVEKDASGQFVTTPEMQQPYMTQEMPTIDKLPTGAAGLGLAVADFLNLRVDNARPPWQDESGRNAWDPGYDISRNAIGEVLPWFIDSQLSSSPYYVPVYGRVSGVASSVPYMYGVRGSSYEPPGSLWDLAGPANAPGGIMTVGDGTYSGEKITNAQAVGGATMGPLDAFAERWSGTAVGGLARSPIGKLLGPKASKFFGETKTGRLLGSGIVEGAEELVSGPSQTSENTSWKDYGRPRYMNGQTNQWEYDKTKPAGPLTPTAFNDAAQNFLSGATLGGTMDGLLMLREGAFNKRHGIDPTAPDIAPARPYNPARIPGSLDRRYDRVEF